MHSQKIGYKSYAIILGRIYVHWLIKKNLKKKHDALLWGGEIFLEEKNIYYSWKIIVILMNGFIWMNEWIEI